MILIPGMTMSKRRIVEFFHSGHLAAPSKREPLVLSASGSPDNEPKVERKKPSTSHRNDQTMTTRAEQSLTQESFWKVLFTPSKTVDICYFTYFCLYCWSSVIGPGANFTQGENNQWFETVWNHGFHLILRNRNI